MELPLSNSDDKVVVDPDIYEELKGTKICLTGRAGNGYAFFWHRGDQKRYYLHKYVMGNPGSQVDHINRNRLDCRRENLRVANASQNSANRGKRKGCSSQYIGVTWDKRDQGWRAQCRINGKNKPLGLYDDEAEAAKVRDRAALSEYGSFAVLNFPDEPYVFKIQYEPIYEEPRSITYSHCTFNITINQ